MIEVDGLTKSYGGTRVVDALTFQVSPGDVVGFLGPNGAGKSTTLRMILGLDSPDAGSARINGRQIGAMRTPMREFGSLLDANHVHPGRKVWTHLLAMAVSNGISPQRVDEVLEEVGMREFAKRKLGNCSLGMRQRVGLAGAILGQPRVLILDEPANGLDPEGSAWLRSFLLDFARNGGSVLLSSHVLSDISIIATRLVVIGEGRLLANATVSEFVRLAALTIVRTPQAKEFAPVLATIADVASPEEEVLEVKGLNPTEVGQLAFANGIEIHELRSASDAVERAFLATTTKSSVPGSSSGVRP